MSSLCSFLNHCTIESSISSPAILIVSLETTPLSAITATSVVPPPISTIIFPTGLLISNPIPIAAAIGSSIKYTSLAFALSPESLTARLSTSVTPEGTHITIFGLANLFRFIFLINPCSISSVILKLAMTPSCKGRIVSKPRCVFPIIALASLPTAITLSS